MELVGEVIYNKNEIIRVVEDFYRDLYNSNKQSRIETNAVTRDVPNITTKKIKRALKGMKRGETPGEDRVIIDLTMNARAIATVKLTNHFNKYLLDGKTRKACKNATTILIHKKGDRKDL